MITVRLPVRSGRAASLGGALIGLALLLSTATSGVAQSPVRAETLDVVHAARLALDSHPLTVRAGADVTAAETDVRIARAPLFPTIALSGSTVRFQEPMVVAPLHAFDPTRPPSFDQTLVQGAVQASYTLFDGGARRAATRQANAGVAGARAARTAAEGDVIAAVIGAYVDVQAGRAGVRAAEAQLEALAAERERAERFFREGAAPRVQVLRAGAAWEEARAADGAARARLSAAEHDLARLTGLDPDDMANQMLADLAAPARGEDFAREVANIEGAPRLETARQRVETARAAEGAARATRFPTVQGLFGFHQFGSGSGGFVGEWQAGVQLTYPVFAGGARVAGSDRARAVASSAEASADAVELELLRALDRAEAARTEAAGRRQALVAAVEQYEEVARIEALSLAEGAGVQRDLLSAEAQLFRTRSSLAQAQAALTRSTVEIARISGALDLTWINQNLESGP